MHELPSRNVLLSLAGAIFFLVLIVYGASLGNDFVRFDDGLLIYENPVIRETSWRSLKKAFTTYDPELYIPFTLLSYKIDYLLGGAHPFLYHFTNVLLHAANAFLVLLLAYILTGSRIGALFMGVFFAIHPLHTEAVAWASARKDLLSTFWFLLALFSYLFYRSRCQVSRSGPEGPSGPRTAGFRFQERKFYFLSLMFFLFGLLSKVMVITLPVVLLLIDWKERRKIDRSMFFDKLPYAFLSIVFGIVALYGKQAVTAQATLWETAVMAPKSAVFYLSKLLVPIRLSVLYPYTDAIDLTSPDFFLPFLILLALFSAALFSLRWTRELLFGFLFSLITLSPTFINFSKDGESYFASDRYAYIPSIGILYIVALFFVWLLRGKKLSTLFPALGIVAILFAALSFKQSLVWANTETLFRNVLRYYPNAHRAHNNLGNVHRRRGEFEAAIASFQAAIEIRESPRTLTNLGAVYRKLGRIEEAIALHERAITLAPKDPEPHFGLGI
ncbi:MAG: tetratricopeptide repeat protein, partial [Patescibacteria group bacterium]